MNDVFEVIDKNGNEVLRRPNDYLKGLTAFQMAQAFPEERKLATRRCRELRKILSQYDDEIDRIYTSNYSNDEKLLSVSIVNTFRSLHPATKELKLLDSFLKMTHSEETRSGSEPGKSTERELMNIEKAKQFPLIDLFDPQYPHETSSTITCRCPFHHERTGSFVIYKRSNRYKCFSCGESGDSIHLYMKLHNCDFKTAVRMLS